jgi:hypothetical protein
LRLVWEQAGGGKQRPKQGWKADCCWGVLWMPKRPMPAVRELSEKSFMELIQKGTVHTRLTSIRFTRLTLFDGVFERRHLLPGRRSRCSFDFFARLVCLHAVLIHAALPAQICRTVLCRSPTGAKFVSVRRRRSVDSHNASGRVLRFMIVDIEANGLVRRLTRSRLRIGRRWTRG